MILKALKGTERIGLTPGVKYNAQIVGRDQERQFPGVQILRIGGALKYLSQKQISEMFIRLNE